MISMQRTLGQPVMVPPGKVAAMTSPGVTSARSLASYIGDNVVNVGVTLYDHQLVDFDRTW
jgi:hypothetical protein